MKIFAMDTSTLTASVAVLDEDKLLGEYTVSEKLTHSQTIMPMADSLLSSLGSSLKDMDAFAVCLGPGSFTGLRIGMATVKSFSQVLNKPVIGVSSLDAAAYNFCYAEDVIICPMIDARRNEVYTSFYKNGEKLIDDKAIHIDELLQELGGKKVIFCGDASKVHEDRIKSRTCEEWKIAPCHLMLPKASSVAYSALKRAKKGDFDDAYTLNPVYLRKSQAERELEEKNKSINNGGNEK